MPSNGFDRFQQGLADLREGFAARAEKKEKKSAAEDLRAGIDSIRTNAAQMGADPQTIEAATSALQLSGGKNSVDVINMIYKQMSRPAQEKLNQLQNRFLAERQNGTLTPQKTAAYQEELMATVNAERLFSGAMHDIKLEQTDKEIKQRTDIENQAAVFRANLGVQTSQIKLDAWAKAATQIAENKFDLRKARVPQVVDKTTFPDGMTPVVLEQQIRNINPDLNENEVGSYVWMYKHRDDKEAQGFMKTFMDTMQESRLFKVQNGNPEKKVEKKETASPTAPPDFLDQLREGEDD